MDSKGQKLLKKYLAGECTEKEKAMLETWFLKQQHDQAPLMTESERLDDMDALRLKLVKETVVAGRLERSILLRIAIAASILLSIGLVYYTFQTKHKNQTENILVERFRPGSNKATLTLSNGEQILLTGAKNGLLATQNKVLVTKTADGEVTYSAAGESSLAPSYNMITTPAGGEYRLMLADGTNVWLNAASSIRYPTSFSGKYRQVVVTGEAYFEVAHDAAKPFMVNSKGQTIEVLGTHFNVNTYENEPVIKTTLLEGAVKITGKRKSGVLKPGQQAIIDDGNLNIISANTNEAIAWKEGFFDFDGADIKTVMRQLARWYDADIQFEGVVSSETFTGRMPRSWNFSQVMKMVGSSNSVHLSIEGRRVMVRQ